MKVSGFYRPVSNSQKTLAHRQEWWYVTGMKKAAKADPSRVIADMILAGFSALGRATIAKGVEAITQSILNPAPPQAPRIYTMYHCRSGQCQRGVIAIGPVIPVRLWRLAV
jgi:hypothetical protein